MNLYTEKVFLASNEIPTDKWVQFVYVSKINQFMPLLREHQKCKIQDYKYIFLNGHEKESHQITLFGYKITINKISRGVKQ